MSKQNSQIDEVSAWLADARHALGRWGVYYRAGFSALIPHDSVIGRAHSGHVQQPINAMRIEYGNENDAVDAIVSGLPEQMRRSLVDVYGLDYPQRHAAERAGMNYRAFRDHLQAAIGGVATGLALLESRVEDAARASRLARLRVA
jgi:hypothetical protein